MANRAYLYSNNRLDQWERPDEGYYDSRWTIPLAWFFFFQSDSIHLIDFQYGDSTWQEVRLSILKDRALDLFEMRNPLLRSIIRDRISQSALEDFAIRIARRPGRYLLMDPSEVLDGVSSGYDDDAGHARRLVEILTAMDDDSGSPKSMEEITKPYVGDIPADVNESTLQVIGYTYWN